LGLYNRPEVAAVPGDVSPTPLKKLLAPNMGNSFIFSPLVDGNIIHSEMLSFLKIMMMDKVHIKSLKQGVRSSSNNSKIN
jgi:hypothetical protein